MMTEPHFSTRENSEWCSWAEKRIRKLEDDLKSQARHMRLLEKQNTLCAKSSQRIKQLEEELEAILLEQCLKAE